MQVSNDYENVAMLKSNPEKSVVSDSEDTRDTNTVNLGASTTSSTPYQDDPIYGNVDADVPVSIPIKVAELKEYVLGNNGNGGFAKEYEVIPNSASKSATMCPLVHNYRKK